MDNRRQRFAALAMLIRLVDCNEGNIDINNESVKRVFNDENETVMIEYANGEVGLLADADFNTMNAAITKWKDENPNAFDAILATWT